MRKSTGFFIFSTVQFVLLGLFFAHAFLERRDAAPVLERVRAMVRRQRLTDLALFTEARYTRHPSQADLSTPFQDHPLSLEHFPSGSLLRPPARAAESAP